MSNSITFRKEDEYVIEVEYEDEEVNDLGKIVKFESNRIASLSERNMEVLSGLRTWDGIRGITVQRKHTLEAN